jgi:hypothetical protein
MDLGLPPIVVNRLKDNNDMSRLRLKCEFTALRIQCNHEHSLQFQDSPTRITEARIIDGISYKVPKQARLLQCHLVVDESESESSDSSLPDLIDDNDSDDDSIPDSSVPFIFSTWQKRELESGFRTDDSNDYVESIPDLVSDSDDDESLPELIDDDYSDSDSEDNSSSTSIPSLIDDEESEEDNLLARNQGRVEKILFSG